MKDEVEDFLRRVAQMRAQAEAQAKGQPSRPAPPPPPPKPPRTPKQPPRLVPQQQETVVLQPEVVDAELSERDRVSRRVADDMRGTEQIAEHARRLGQEVDAADDKLQAHLHQVFDHQLGHLKKSATDTAAPAHATSSPELSSSDILRMLTSPTAIRDAIIMAEVLHRPEHLW